MSNAPPPLKVMMTCPRTGVTVDTQLTLREGQSLRSLGHKSFLCSACGRKHTVYTLSHAFVEAPKK